MVRLHKKKLQTVVLTTLTLMTYSAWPKVSGANGQNYIFQYKFYDKGQVSPWDSQPSTFTVSANQKAALQSANSYWSDILGPGLNISRPAVISVFTNDAYNAGSWSDSLKYEGQEYKVSQLEAYLLGLDTSAQEATGLMIGSAMFPPDAPWEDYLTPLPQSANTSLNATFIHELGHSLGICSTVEQEDYLPTGKGNFSVTGINRWDSHLYDWRGTQAKTGMEIKLPESTVSSQEWFDLPTYAYYSEGTDYKAPYFSGEHVQEVLANNSLEVYDILGKKTEQKVTGIPINGPEILAADTVYVEMSHIELRNGNMSHQRFRNYNTFMEAELAALQDIGYTIDRRNFFGHSVYGSGLTLHNTNPFWARNAAGTAYVDNTYNNSDFGMGLHVYGSNNTIYQEADLLTDGAAGVGIRVDGVSNTISVEPGILVYADGVNGNGLLVAYGKNHNITIKSGSAVQAVGEKGIGAAFDFGTNVMDADFVAMRASYAAWSIDYWLTPDYAKYVAEVETDGPLVDTFAINGKLAGTKAAIYMSENAYVKNVVIGTGAEIWGDIINNWVYDDATLDSMNRSKMYRQYTGTDGLVTNLSFAGNGLSYDGDIAGKINTRLTVEKGELTYQGTANVLSTTVQKGAGLYGNGTYVLAVPDDSANHSSVFNINSQPHTMRGVGLFINHGTLGATTGDVNIRGDLVGDGTIDVASADNGNRVYLLQVEGDADITGSTLAAQEKNKPLLNKKYNYLTATEGVTGNVSAVNLSDYVKAVGTVEGNNAFFTASQTKALGDTMGLNENESSVAKAFNNTAPILMQQENTVGQQAANVFYNNAGDMKKIMNSVTAAERTKLLGQTPMSGLTANSIYGRLDTNAFDGTVGVPVNVPGLAGENKTVNTNVPVTLDANNNFWMKMFRGFEGYGGSNGESNLNNQSFGGVVGYDRAVGQDARLGGFFAYGKTSYSADYLNGNSNDWRLGLYGDKQNGDWEYQGYASYGANHYDLDASTWDSTTKLNSDFKAKIWDIGLKAKYTIPSTKEKTWKIRPYGELGYAHTNQEGYTESGNSAFAKNVDSVSNNSTRAELGVEFKRRITPTSGWGGSIGYKRILSGVNPELNGTFIGGTDNFTVKTENDRNYLTYNLNAYTSLGSKWTGQAEIRGEKSSNNHKEVYSISAKYHF